MRPEEEVVVHDNTGTQAVTLKLLIWREYIGLRVDLSQSSEKKKLARTFSML